MPPSLEGPDLPITYDNLEDVVTLMPGAVLSLLGKPWENGGLMGFNGI